MIESYSALAEIPSFWFAQSRESCFGEKMHRSLLFWKGCYFHDCSELKNVSLEEDSLLVWLGKKMHRRLLFWKGCYSRDCSELKKLSLKQNLVWNESNDHVLRISWRVWGQYTKLQSLSFPQLWKFSAKSISRIATFVDPTCLIEFQKQCFDSSTFRLLKTPWLAGIVPSIPKLETGQKIVIPKLGNLRVRPLEFEERTAIRQIDGGCFS
jgi:hypothetical protein